MKIGTYVKSYVRKIFDYCETVDHTELDCLLDLAYSKKTFDVNFPFCKETRNILPEESKRFWTPIYIVRGRSVRVTSQWYDSHVSNSRALFTQYILGKKIATKEELAALSEGPSPSISEKILAKPSRRSNARYRGNAIGNSQNLLVRHILSNLGEESFCESDWAETKAYFGNRCAYCSAEDELIMEHAVPINRQALGEHRLGNLVPSCRRCNDQKAEKDYREFLQTQPDRIGAIERYMDEKNYVPLGDNEQVRMILDMAYKEVAIIADRYLLILNSLFADVGVQASDSDSGDEESYSSDGLNR